jgi:LmbE family N-acetylglucosaminyl deacetylase
MKICIVSPHIDDAILSCGIFMQRRRAAGDEILAVNIFSAGTNSENRKKEEAAAEDVMGVTPYFLDELDAPDRNRAAYGTDQGIFFGKLDPNDPAIPRVTQRLADFFKEHNIELAIFPLAAGTHIDHRIAFEAGRRTKGVGVRFYEDRPYILWPGILQIRMQQVGGDAELPKITEEQMRASLNDYHYLKHFVPKGAYQDECLPQYFKALNTPSSKALKAKSDTLVATDAEVKKIYEALSRYTSQMGFIYPDYDTFLKDSLRYERAMTGRGAYAERSWTLEG